MSKQKDDSVFHIQPEGIEPLQKAKERITVSKRVLSSTCLVLVLFLFVAGLSGCQHDCSCTGDNNYGGTDSDETGCAVASANLNVTMDGSETDDEIEVRITVINLGDDDAYDTKLVVLLPINVHILDITPADSRVVSFNQCGGRVIYCLGQMNKHNNTTNDNFERKITIKTSRLIKKDCNHCEEISAFGYSSSPDQELQNNYSTWKANCASKSSP